MILKLRPFNAVVLCLLFALPCAAKTITIDADTHIRIVEQGPFDNAGGALTDTLSKYLLAATKRDSLEGTGTALTITLEPRYALWQDVPASELSGITDIDEYTITITAGANPAVHIKGCTILATGYGMMDFLENDIGIMWLFPGELGIALPRTTSFKLKAGSRSLKPAMASRFLSGHLLTNKDYNLKYAVYTGALQKNGIFFKSYDYFKAMRPHILSYSSHALMHIYPPEKIAKEYPHIQPIVDGKRIEVDKHKTSHGGPFHSWQPCYAEEDTYNLAIAWAKKQFDKGGYMVSLGVNDGKNTLCECEHCAKIGWPHVYYQFVNRVAEAVKDYYPPRMIGVIAYGSAGKPPVGMKLHENVSVTVVARDTETVRTWSTIAQHLGMYEYFYGIWYWFPQLPLDAMSTNAKQYRKYNIEDLYAEAYPVWAFDAPKMHIRWKLMWNPDLDVHAELARFCDAAFGKGAEPMRQLYEYWAAKVQYYHDPDGISPMVDMKLRMRPDEQFAMMSEADFAKTESLLKQAKAAATGELESKRLEMVETFFAYSHTLHTMHMLSNRLANADTTIDVRAASDRIAALTNWSSALEETMRSHDEWYVGTSTTPEMIFDTRWGAGKGIDQQLGALIKAATYTTSKKLGVDAVELQNLPAELTRYAKPASVEPKKVYLRKTHPWYKAERFVAMDVKQDGNVLTWTTSENGKPLDPDKVYWTNFIMINELIDGKTAYAVDFDVKGANGTLKYFANIGSNNRSVTPVQQTHVLSAKGERTHKNLIMEPLLVDGTTGKLIPATEPPQEPYVKSNLELFVLFYPEGDNASFSGVCTVDKLTLPPVEAAP